METGRVLISMLVMWAFLSGCNNEEDVIDFTANDRAHVQTEELMSAYLEDAADIGGNVLFSDPDIQNGMRSGRVIDPIDLRYNCASVSVEYAADNIPASPGIPAVPHGFITLDFGSGCATLSGVVRKGILVIEFKRHRFSQDSFFSITFDDYSANGISLTGNRTEITSATSSNHIWSFQVELDVIFLFPDGTTATRSAAMGRLLQMQFALSSDLWTVSGSASGKTRDGYDYQINYVQSSHYWSHCTGESPFWIPLQGIKELLVDARKIQLDYGSSFVDTGLRITLAGCERGVTVSIDGKSMPIEISADGN